MPKDSLECEGSGPWWTVRPTTRWTACYWWSAHLYLWWGRRGDIPSTLGQDYPHFLDIIRQEVRLQLASLAPALSLPHIPLHCGSFGPPYPASPCVFYGTAPPYRGQLFRWVGYLYRHLAWGIVGSTIFLKNRVSTTRRTYIWPLQQDLEMSVIFHLPTGVC